MYIQLEDDDCREIAELIAEADDGSGSVYYSDLEIKVSYYKIVKYDREDDYFNGTGAWIVKDLQVEINEIKCLDGTNVVCDFETIVKYLKGILE